MRLRYSVLINDELGVFATSCYLRPLNDSLDCVIVNWKEGNIIVSVCPEIQFFKVPNHNLTVT